MLLAPGPPLGLMLQCVDVSGDVVSDELVVVLSRDSAIEVYDDVSVRLVVDLLVPRLSARFDQLAATFIYLLLLLGLTQGACFEDLSELEGLKVGTEYGLAESVLEQSVSLAERPEVPSNLTLDLVLRPWVVETQSDVVPVGFLDSVQLDQSLVNFVSAREHFVRVVRVVLLHVVSVAGRTGLVEIGGLVDDHLAQFLDEKALLSGEQAEDRSRLPALSLNELEQVQLLGHFSPRLDHHFLKLASADERSANGLLSYLRARLEVVLKHAEQICVV